MKRQIRVLLTAFIVISVAGIAILVFLRYSARETYKVTVNEGKKPGVRMEKIRYSGTKAGRLEWELVADSAVRSKDRDETLFQTVYAVFYTKDGAPYRLTARDGRLKESAGEIDASGGVKVVSDDGYNIASERVKYAIKTKELTSEDPATIETAGMDCKGVGLLVRVDKGTISLLKNVKAVFHDAAL